MVSQYVGLGPAIGALSGESWPHLGHWPRRARWIPQCPRSVAKWRSHDAGLPSEKAD